MNRDAIIQTIRKERELLESSINQLIKDRIQYIPIANKELMPYGWRKAGKGRTVWRIIEEVISQNLEMYGSQYGFRSVIPAQSEVGVYDFEFDLQSGSKSFVNIKSAVIDGKVNKDDISKAIGLIDFLEENMNCKLYVATFLIRFTEDMNVELVKCIVCPTTWIPDVYVNPSNNGNLQSSKYKDLTAMVPRTNQEFLVELKEQNKIAKLGGKTKLQKLVSKQMKTGESLSSIAQSLELTTEQLKVIIE
ncbi:hypothetical protein KO561_19260 [Radiobacillus kanasensis]|uniref:hypothetical protein n=1 Tax=Radiobacillus kanasensis TaxID=2844358 RepID=UPI001E32B1A9|nr:hypothetical protein [Radiobacillus kanasensis]UFT99284.1 hypothetical protein KO561_19260 [Radiobacillus kanasensis]